MLHSKLGKRGEGLPFQIIIIAIILLVTLVVVLVFFTSKFGSFGKDIASCQNKGGECIATKCPEDSDKDAYHEITGTCAAASDKCCAHVKLTAK